MYGSGNTTSLTSIAKPSAVPFLRTGARPHAVGALCIISHLPLKHPESVWQATYDTYKCEHIGGLQRR